MKLLDWILDLLYPPKCAFCHKLLKTGEKGACKRCMRALPRVPDGRRTEKIANISLCVAPLYYRDGVRDSLRRYKFGHVPGYKDIYADLISQVVAESGVSFDFISFVPISRRRKRVRGYDQTRLIAEGLANRLSVPCLPTLKKRRHNPPQSTLDGEAARKRNVSGAYKCLSEERVRGKKILLVDDIVTTGATLSECALTLRRAGAEEIIAAAVATAH